MVSTWMHHEYMRCVETGKMFNGRLFILYTFYTMDTESFLGVKQPGHGVDHPLPSSTEVGVELYVCSTSGPLWPVLGWALPLHFTNQDTHSVVTANWTAGFWFLAEAGIFLSQYSDWVSVLSRNRLSRVWNSPPTVAEVTNWCKFTPLPHMSTQYPG
jgi:hypothetical protein